MAADWPPPPVARPAVVVPAAGEAPLLLWRALLALDERLGSPWCLVGGQLVVLHCLEHGVPPVRATYDGDVAVDVFAGRDALSVATGVLDGLGFAQRTDSRGYGYRWERGNARIDVLVPERSNAQRRPPLTRRGARSVEAPAVRQAVERAERVPVRAGDETGYVPRPNLLGAIVAKAAAAVADTRDPERHREDVAVLCSLAATTSVRAMLRDVTKKDRQRLRKIAPHLSPDAPVWRHAPDRTAAADVFALLLDDPRSL
jgi:hypothetical protein